MARWFTSRRAQGGWLWRLIVVLGAVTIASAAQAGPIEDLRALVPLWRANAPLCSGAPSAQDCHDGDMTLFNGLLCASGEALGCDSVAGAQDQSGRWHRSVRYRQHPELRPDNSFSWDMALGVQLYAVTRHDRAALERWMSWVETHRPCLSKAPLPGQDICLVRGLPRWCTDDTENGCTAKPQGLAILYRTARFLGATIPPPAEDKAPGGPLGNLVTQLIAQAREANAAFSLQRLMTATKDTQPTVILIDASVNRAGFPRHLTATEILLYRMTGGTAPDVDLAAQILARREPWNAFFAYVAEGPTESAAAKALAVAPKRAQDLPAARADWTWQREEADQPWKRAKLWDFVFIGNLFSPH